MNTSSLRGYRTYIIAALGVVTAWIYYLVGDLSLKEAVEASFSAAGLAALRAGVAGRVNVKVIAMLCGMALMGLTGCAGISAGPVTVGYALPKDGGKIEVTLFPDKLFRSGKRVVPTGK